MNSIRGLAGQPMRSTAVPQQVRPCRHDCTAGLSPPDWVLAGGHRDLCRRGTTDGPRTAITVTRC